MYTTLKVDYRDGQRVKFNTEPCGPLTARSLLATVFNMETDAISARFYDDTKDKNKPLKMRRV